MASVAREKLTHETLRDAGCVTQLAMATACGMGFGLFGALCTFTMAYPTLSGKPSGALFANIAYQWVPSITAGAVVFSLVACATEANRGVKDEFNSAVGGFAGAFTYGALKFRAPHAPFVAGLMGALAVASADAWDRLSPTLEDIQAKQHDPKYTTVPPSSTAFASSAIISTGVTNRLLK